MLLSLLISLLISHLSFVSARWEEVTNLCYENEYLYACVTEGNYHNTLMIGSINEAVPNPTSTPQIIINDKTVDNFIELRYDGNHSSRCADATLELMGNYFRCCAGKTDYTSKSYNDGSNCIDLDPDVYFVNKEFDGPKSPLFCGDCGGDQRWWRSSNTHPDIPFTRWETKYVGTSSYGYVGEPEHICVDHFNTVTNDNFYSVQDDTNKPWNLVTEVCAYESHVYACAHGPTLSGVNRLPSDFNAHKDNFPVLTIDSVETRDWITIDDNDKRSSCSQALYDWGLCSPETPQAVVPASEFSILDAAALKTDLESSCGVCDDTWWRTVNETQLPADSVWRITGTDYPVSGFDINSDDKDYSKIPNTFQYRDVAFDCSDLPESHVCNDDCGYNLVLPVGHIPLLPVPVCDETLVINCRCGNRICPSGYDCISGTCYPPSHIPESSMRCEMKFVGYVYRFWMMVYNSGYQYLNRQYDDNIYLPIFQFECKDIPSKIGKIELNVYVHYSYSYIGDSLIDVAILKDCGLGLSRYSKSLISSTSCTDSLLTDIGKVYYKNNPNRAIKITTSAGVSPKVGTINKGTGWKKVTIEEDKITNNLEGNFSIGFSMREPENTYTLVNAYSNGIYKPWINVYFTPECSITDGSAKNYESCQCGSIVCESESFCHSGGGGTCRKSDPGPFGYPIIHSGTCSNIGAWVIEKKAWCESAAESMGLNSTVTVINGNNPPGCYLSNDVLYFNSNIESTSTSTTDKQSICVIADDCYITQLKKKYLRFASAVSTGSSSCLECPAGKTVTRTGRQVPCTECEAGKYQDLTGQTECAECASGWGSPAGSSSCSQCLAGQYADGVCKSCPSGQYQDQAGQTECAECASGWASPAGSYVSSSCTECPAGTYSANGVCTECASGKYQNQTGQTECAECASGKYQNQTGQTECAECASGSVSPAGSSSCTECPANTYSANGVCTECASGWASPAGSSSCTECPAGTYSVNGVCTECPEGKYQNQNGQTECAECASGWGSPAGSSVSSSCTECLAGQYADGVCKSCPEGKYQNQTGQTECAECTSGTNSVAGSTNSANCTCPVGEGIVVESVNYTFVQKDSWGDGGSTIIVKDDQDVEIMKSAMVAGSRKETAFEVERGKTYSFILNVYDYPQEQSYEILNEDLVSVKDASGLSSTEFPTGEIESGDNIFSYTIGLCTECPSGTYSVNGVCTECPSGFISPVGSSSCTLTP
jgi:hypothetical protein